MPPRAYWRCARTAGAACWQPQLFFDPSEGTYARDGLRDLAWQHAHPAVALRELDRWGLGLAALFFAVPISARDMPMRVLVYIQAFRALRSHRACSVSDTPP